jgi:hypothetical protein
VRYVPTRWDRKQHYIQKQWRKRESLIAGQKRVVNAPITTPEKVNFPPLHFKLGLIKNFVEAMDQISAGFMYMKNKLSRISDGKIKDRIFVGPQIRELLLDEKN